MKKFAQPDSDGYAVGFATLSSGGPPEGYVSIPDGTDISKIRDGFRYHITTDTWLPLPSPPVTTQWNLVRDQRNALLVQSDWTQLPDVPLATKDAWATYRQALRDITNQPDPFNIVWPVAPG